jgi:hypothetical protein
MIKLQRLIQKMMILRYRVLKIPVLMVFQEQTIKIIYGKKTKYISFSRSMYINALLSAIDNTINLTGKKPVVIKV